MQRRLVRIANAVLDLEPSTAEAVNVSADGLCQGFCRPDRNVYGIEPAKAAIDAVGDFLAGRPMNWNPDPDASELRAKLSEYVSLPVDHISCYAGTRLAVEDIFRTYLEAGTEIAMSGPVLENIRIAARCTGARLVEIHHNDPLNPAIEDLVNSVSPRTRAIYLGNPNEISGVSFGEAELIFLLAYAERTMVIVDETYFEFSGQTIADLISRFPNLTIVRSLERGFGLLSFKAGYILSDPENLNYINRIKGENGPDAAAQIASLATLENLDHPREYIAEVNRSRKSLGNSLKEIGYSFKISSADFMLLKVTDPRDAAIFLRSENIPARDLSGVTNLTGYIRVPIGRPQQTDILLLALSRTAERFATGLNRNRIPEIGGKSKKKTEASVSAT